MLNGLYTATSGMLALNRKIEIISNNLANINTTSYKREDAVFTNYLYKDERNPQGLIRQSEYNKTINNTVSLHSVFTDFESGNLMHTGNKLDLALETKNTFFAVETPFGIRFTRDGHFTLDKDRRLVNKDGFPVLSRNYENNEGIILPDGDITITEKGEILVNGAIVDQLFIAEVDDPSKMQKMGRNLYAAIGFVPDESESPVVKQGFLEGSNVNPVKEMVAIIDAMRGFETYQKVIQTIDEINSRTSNDIGRLA
ncbi:flagellar hook-basal body protein [Deferribacter thermophilus]|uniref:flagellar hook-basal body protein n=1 Tax=Deferribacter thermophilus TaxID=53573 RepID=UPI003C15D79C